MSSHSMQSVKYAAGESFNLTGLDEDTSRNDIAIVLAGWEVGGGRWISMRG